MNNNRKYYGNMGNFYFLYFLVVLMEDESRDVIEMVQECMQTKSIKT